jgi:hypothetical protein
VKIQKESKDIFGNNYKLKSNIMKKFGNQPFLELENKIRHKVFEIEY